MLGEAGLSEQRGGRVLSAVVTVRGEDSGDRVSPPRRLFDGRVQLAFHAVAALPAPIGVYGDRQFDRKRRPLAVQGRDVDPSVRRGRGAHMRTDIHLVSFGSSSLRPRITAQRTI